MSEESNITFDISHIVKSGIIGALCSLARQHPHGRHGYAFSLHNQVGLLSGQISLCLLLPKGSNTGELRPCLIVVSFLFDELEMEL
jgi:hypothetical protein